MKRITYWPQAVLGKSRDFFSSSQCNLTIRYPPRACVQLGHYAGLVRRCGSRRLGGLSATICREYLLDIGLRYGLRSSGKRRTKVFPKRSLKRRLGNLQDKNDDVKVNIRSTALLFGDHTVSILSAFSASSLSLISYAGYLNGHGMPFFAGIGLAGFQLAKVLKQTKWNERESCWKGFVQCGWVGIWIWAGASVDYALSITGLL